VQTSEIDDINDLAHDVIASLFKRNDKGEFVYLKRYFSRHMDLITKDPSHALVLSKILVVARTRQGLVEYFKEVDPNGAKIYRNLKMTPKRNPQVVEFRLNNETYFYLKSNKIKRIPDDLHPELPEVDSAQTVSWLMSAEKSHKTTPRIVGRLLQLIKEDGRYRHFISLSLLFECWRKYEGLIHPVPLDKLNLTSSESVEIADKSWQRVVAQLKKFIEHTIHKTYLNKGKIDKLTAQRYQTIASHYFEDIINGAPKTSLNGYIKKVFDDSNPSAHRIRLEYIIKQSKLFLKEKL